MINSRKFTAALAVALAVASTPALAKSRASHVGGLILQQSIEGVVSPDGVSPDRAQALRACNEVAAPFKNYSWGNTPSNLYRSCMTQHGQPE
jgi:hypothetical protein